MQMEQPCTSRLFSRGASETMQFALHTVYSVHGQECERRYRPPSDRDNWFATHPGGELEHAAIFMEEGI